MVRLREDRKDDANKKRDREFSSSQSKRMRLERYANLQWRNKGKDVENGGAAGDSSADGSFTEECFYEEEYDGKAQLFPSKETHAHRSSFWSSPMLSFRIDLLASPVPRRARSTSLKRSNEHKRLCSTGKKMKELQSKAQMPTASLNPGSSLEDDIEIEVVEALFDLKNQSPSHSKKFQASSPSNAAEKLPCLPADITSPISDGGSMDTPLFSEITSRCEQSIKMGNANSFSKLEKICCRDNAPNSLEKWNYPKEPAGDSVDREDSMTREQGTAPGGEESRLCIKSKSDDSTNSVPPKANSAAELLETQSGDGIDLMAHLPMSSSPEKDKDVLTDEVPRTQMKSKTMIKDECFLPANSHVEGKMQTIYVKQETVKLDAEKHHRDNYSSSGYNKLAESNSLHLPVAVTGPGRPGSFLPGYMPPILTIMQMDDCARSSAGLQALPFKLFNPQPKRCIMHQHIAHNIRSHQQFTKNTMSAASVTSASFCKSELNCVNPTASAPNSIVGKQLKGDLPVGKVFAAGLSFNGKCENSEAASTTDAIMTKQVLVQQACQHPPATKLPCRDIQTGKTFCSNTSDGEHPGNSSLAPSSLPAIEVPSFIILQNNSYQFPIPKRGLPPVVQGAQPSLLPSSNASYCPSFCFTQNQQKEPTSHPDPSQHAPWNTSKSTCSSSSQKHSHNLQQIGNQTSGKGILSLTAMQQVSPSSCKSDKATAVDSRESVTRRISHRKSLAVPIQPINLALLPQRALDCSGGNHPTVFQILPNIAQGGYQLVHGAQVAQQRNFLVAERKSVIGADSSNDGITRNFGKSVAQPTNFPRLGCNNPSNLYMRESAIGGSPKYLHFLPSPLVGSQSSGSSSTAFNAVFPVNTPQCYPQLQQQQGLIEFAEQHGLQLRLTSVAQVSSAVNTYKPHKT